MTHVFRHPNYWKKLKKENKKNNLTKDSNYDKGIYNEKIQNQSDGHGTRGSRNNSISKRTND